MNILFYDWKSYSAPLITEAFKNLGHSVSFFSSKLGIYEIDAQIMRSIIFQIHKEKIDFIFSLNYIPLLSSIGEICKIPYILWTYDSPHFTLYSPTRKNSCNYQFIFDKEEYFRLTQINSTNVFYEPLASAPSFFSKIVHKEKKYAHDICFLGSLYDVNPQFEDEYLRGYVDSIVNSQSKLYGMNLCELILSENIAKEILTSANVDIPTGYCISLQQAATNVVEKIVNKKERQDYLQAIGSIHNLHIYTNSKHNNTIKATYHGYAKYTSEMPLVFYNTKINLNFAPRSIHRGVSLRVFDILACSGFLLTTWQEDLSDIFTIGRDLDTFASEEELLEKIDFYLKHDDERIKIAKQGYQLISNTRSYEIVLSQMLSKVFSS